VGKEETHVGTVMDCGSMIVKHGGYLRCQLESGHEEDHSFVIRWSNSEAYVPPPPPPTIDEQVDSLRTKFPDVAAFDKDGNLLTSLAEHKYGWFTLRWTMPLPEGKYNMDKVWVAFDVPPGFPAARPENFYTDPDLRLSWGGYIRNTSHGVRKGFGTPKHKWKTFEIMPYNEPVNVQLVHGHVQAWNPNHDTLFTYAMVIKQAMHGVWMPRRGY
jgi:hypothetical protein